MLESVESFDLATERVARAALDDPESMVFKPRGEMGGEGVVVWASASEDERAATLAEIERAPERMIAQRRVELSTHPTVCDGPARAAARRPPPLPDPLAGGRMGDAREASRRVALEGDP